MHISREAFPSPRGMCIASAKVMRAIANFASREPGLLQASLALLDIQPFFFYLHFIVLIPHFSDLHQPDPRLLQGY